MSAERDAAIATIRDNIHHRVQQLHGQVLDPIVLTIVEELAALSVDTAKHIAFSSQRTRCETSADIAQLNADMAAWLQP